MISEASWVTGRDGKRVDEVLLNPIKVNSPTGLRKSATLLALEQRKGEMPAPVKAYSEGGCKLGFDSYFLGPRSRPLLEDFTNCASDFQSWSFSLPPALGFPGSSFLGPLS
jgi:hypothetical protein